MLWDVIIEAVVPSDVDGPCGASGCPGLELRGLEPLTSSMPWKRPPNFCSSWLQLALFSRVRCPLGPISAETRTSKLLSSVTTHGLPDASATCNCKGSASHSPRSLGCLSPLRTTTNPAFASLCDRVPRGVRHEVSRYPPPSRAYGSTPFALSHPAPSDGRPRRGGT